MSEKNADKPQVTAPKSFLAAGPTLHYSHDFVLAFWLLTALVYGLTCLFWTKIATGTLGGFNLGHVFELDSWKLDQYILSGISIFEYPWQILVLGLLMGILAMTPILVAQLMSFRYSVLLIFEALILADLPGLAVSLVISCLGVACRPLRFRSRAIAIALCMAPQLVYWSIFGPVPGGEPIVWGFSFSPWGSAWLLGLTLAGIVLGIGHFTRYKPGLISSSTGLLLIAALLIFERTIGFDELAYQLYIANNDPEQVVEFHDHSITEALDATIKDKAVTRYLSEFFYPTELIPLREELKREIQVQLGYDRWPSWFLVPKALKYQDKRQWLLQQYQMFIDPPKLWWMPRFLHNQLVAQRQNSRRMVVALYYQALLNEISPDIPQLDRTEVLRFYSDYPHERSREIWFRLYQRFDRSPEAIEARFRIAMHWAGQGRFGLAEKIVQEACVMLERVQEQADSEDTEPVDTIFRPFHPPSFTIMTSTKLAKLKMRLARLAELISEQNRNGDPDQAQRLATLVMLNPHTLGYEDKLRSLLERTNKADPIRDNVLLAQAMLATDDQALEETLAAIHQDFKETDGAREALYELSLLRIRLYQNETHPDPKAERLATARATLVRFIELYPDSLFTGQVRQNLAALPTPGD